jgi:hypothetical protein
MRRREFITLLSGAAVWPVVAHAQQISKMPRIGYFMDRSGPGLFDEAFLVGLRENGYVVGQNIAIEYRWTEGKTEKLPALVADLVSHKVDVIVTAGAESVKVAKQATTHDPNCVRGCLRSDRQRLHCEFFAARREHHWVHQSRRPIGQQMVAATQGDCSQG